MFRHFILKKKKKKKVKEMEQSNSIPMSPEEHFYDTPDNSDIDSYQVGRPPDSDPPPVPARSPIVLRSARPMSSPSPIRSNTASSSGSDVTVGSRSQSEVEEPTIDTTWEANGATEATSRPVSSRNADRIHIEPKRYIASSHCQPSLFDCPCAIAVSPVDGTIYITDPNRSQIVRIAEDGRLIQTIGSRGQGVGQLQEPRGVAVSGDGLVAVSDTLNHRIQIFDEHAASVRIFGSFGSDKGQLFRPAGLAFHPNGTLYVADKFNNRIQVFSAEGRFLEAFGTEGHSVGQFSRPSDVAVSAAGDVFIADTNNDRLQIWKPCEKVEVIGSTGSGNRQFLKPESVAVHDDFVAVTDVNNFRVQVLSTAGEFEGYFGQRGSDKGQFDQLAGIAINDRNKDILVTDLYNRTVQMF